MRGHHDLIAQRLRGRAPRIVFVNDYPCRTNWFETHDHATLCTAGDPLSSLDLRCLVGLRVSISATTEARAKALFDRAKAAGAAVVAACADQTGWAEIFHKTE